MVSYKTVRGGSWLTSIRQECIGIPASMIRMLGNSEGRSRTLFVAISVLLVLAVGTVDYLTGVQLFFSVFYLLGVGLAAWFAGRTLGLLVSVFSVCVWIAGDLAAGASYPNPLIPLWNALILLFFYFVVVWLLVSLRGLHEELESRVRQRTEELTREMRERQRLEAEILKVSEREQRRIGHDLHDGLCQHLTATALAGQVLGDRLASRDAPEARDAEKVVELVEEGISLARNFARGLYPVEMEAEGLMAAFEEMAANISSGARVHCYFRCVSPVLIHDDAAATHLYRIAQEAVLNAIRHGRAKNIGIDLSEQGGQVRLSIEDDGAGIAETPPPTTGLGIRIMDHRAKMIGGTFSIEPAPSGGAIVTCCFPARSAQAATSQK